MKCLKRLIAIVVIVSFIGTNVLYGSDMGRFQPKRLFLHIPVLIRIVLIFYG